MHSWLSNERSAFCNRLFCFRRLGGWLVVSCRAQMLMSPLCPAPPSAAFCFLLSFWSMPLSLLSSALPFFCSCPLPFVVVVTLTAIYVCVLHASSSNARAGETGRGVAARVRRVGGGSERAGRGGGTGAAGDAAAFGAPN